MLLSQSSKVEASLLLLKKHFLNCKETEDKKMLLCSS